MIISRIPIGPSINELYNPINGRLIKSKSGRIYDEKIKIFKLKNFKLLQAVHVSFKDTTLCVDKYFIFPHSRLFCKDGRVKRLDVENFLKSFNDALSFLIDIDDKYFRSGNCDTLSCQKESDAQVVVKISNHTHRYYDVWKNDCKDLGLQM